MSPEPEYHKEKLLQKPCFYMESLLNKDVDRRTTPLEKLFVKFHVWYCFPCRNFVNSIRDIKSRLALKEPTDAELDALKRLQNKLDLGSGE